MTKKEMKELLNEKCNESWDSLTAMRNVYGDDDKMIVIYRTKWITYENLYKEIFDEQPKYKD